MQETVESGAPVAVETNVELPAEDNGIVGESTTHPQEPEPEAKTEPEKEPDSSEEKAKKPGGWKRKLDRQAAYIQELESKLNGANQPQQAKAGNEPPKESDYDNVMDWITAQAEYVADKKLSDYQQKQMQEQEVQQLQKMIASHEEREAAYEQEVPDYEEKISVIRDSGLLTPDIQKAVLSSDMSEKIAYHLGNYPSDLLVMQNLKGQALKQAIATIEDFIENQPKTAVKQTRAAAPISPVTSKAGASTKAPTEMTQQEIEAWRYGRK